MSREGLGARIQKALEDVRRRRPNYRKARRKFDRLVAEALRAGMAIPVTWLEGWPEKY